MKIKKLAEVVDDLTIEDIPRELPGKFQTKQDERRWARRKFNQIVKEREKLANCD